MDKGQVREVIAKRIAQEFRDGDVVNLGIGLPTLVSNYVLADVDITLQSENGLLGLGRTPVSENTDKNLTDAGGCPASIKPGGSFFDSATSFAIIRGGHVDITVLGALQVDEKGNLANWMIPGKMAPGMGGAMDLVNGARRVIVAMEHTIKGTPKILKQCTLPLTAANQVNLIVTEMAVIEVTPLGLLLKELGPGITLEQVQAATEAQLIVPDDILNVR